MDNEPSSFPSDVAAAFQPHQAADESSAVDVDHGWCSALAGLQMTALELQALRRQGFVSREQRGKRSYFKLRFRLLGQQRAKYIGSDPAVARQVQRNLDVHQAERRSELELAYCDGPWTSNCVPPSEYSSHL